MHSIKEQSYLKGAGILAISGIIVRFIGLFFRVPLYQLLGSYGNGIFANVSTIYTLLLLISTAGFPVAISKMVSEYRALGNIKGVNDTFRIAMLLMFSLGGLSSLFLLSFTNWIIQVTGWPQESYYALKGIAFLPLVVSVSSAYRGYFQGHQFMNPTAISQIIDQTFRVFLGLLLCWYCVSVFDNVALGVSGAFLASTIGAIISLAYLVFYKHIYTSKTKNKPAQSFPGNRLVILKRLLLIAIPITLTSGLIALYAFIDSFIYIDRLAIAGISSTTAVEMMGDFSNADTIINVPLVLSSALAIAMIPAISESFILNDKKALKEKMETAIKAIIVLGLPCCLGLLVLSNGIIDLLFPGSIYGGQLLKYYALATFFIMLATTFQSILQAIDKFFIPLINLIIGTCIKVTLSYYFLAQPAFNINGIILSSGITFLYLMVSNYLFLCKYMKIKINKTIISKPVLCSVIMALGAKTIYTWGISFANQKIITLITIFLSILFYLILIIRFNVLSEAELKLLPFQKQFFKIYSKNISSKKI